MIRKNRQLPVVRLGTPALTTEDLSKDGEIAELISLIFDFDNNKAIFIRVADLCEYPLYLITNDYMIG